MNELSNTKLQRPMDKLAMGGDVAALNALLNIMNDPNVTGAVVPKGAAVKAGDVMRDNTVPTPEPTIAPTPVSAAPLPATPRNPQRIFYTGLPGVGKSYVAQQTGALIFDMADPLRHLAEYFFGQFDQTLPGIKQFLQAAEQWGRGDISEQLPLTPARACFVSMIRSLGEAGRFDSALEVDWASYGRNKDIWLNATNARVEKTFLDSPDARFAITNCCFSHDFKRLKELGWMNFHIMSSPETRVKRGYKPSTADALTNALNADVTKQISAQSRGAKLRVIWSDNVPPPSPRLYSVAEFLSTLTISDNQTMIVTGE